MLEMLRNNVVEYRNTLRSKYYSYIKYDNPNWEWISSVSIEINGNPNVVRFNESTFIVINASIEEMVACALPSDNHLTLFLYDDREYEHFKELGLDSYEIHTRMGMIPYGSYRMKVELSEPVFSLYQSIHSSEFDYELFRNKLDRNKFNYTIGHNAFCTDVHFYDAKDYNRFKLTMLDYCPPMYWFNPYINPGYFKNIFGE